MKGIILLPSACMHSKGTVVGSGVSVCYLTTHFSNVRLSHKRYDLPNGYLKTLQCKARVVSALYVVGHFYRCRKCACALYSTTWWKAHLFFGIFDLLDAPPFFNFIQTGSSIHVYAHMYNFYFPFPFSTLDSPL